MNIFQKKCFCAECYLQFDNSIIYKLHLKLVHKTEMKSNSIDNELDSIENNSESMKELKGSNHIVSMTPKKVKMYKCESCNHKSAKNNRIQRHDFAVHKRKKP